MLIVMLALAGLGMAEEYANYWVEPGPGEYVEITYGSVIMAALGPVLISDAPSYLSVDFKIKNVTSHEIKHHVSATGTGNGNVTIMEEI